MICILLYLHRNDMEISFILYMFHTVMGASLTTINAQSWNDLRSAVEDNEVQRDVVLTRLAKVPHYGLEMS